MRNESLYHRVSEYYLCTVLTKIIMWQKLHIDLWTYGLNPIPTYFVNQLYTYIRILLVRPLFGHGLIPQSIQHLDLLY